MLNSRNIIVSPLKKKKTINKIEMNSVSQGSFLGIEFDKPHKRIVGSVSFMKMFERKPMSNLNNPHEKRFEYFDLPQQSYKMKKFRNIIFDKQANSDNSQLFCQKSGGLNYDVNYNQVLPRINRGVLDYSKISPRKSIRNPVYSLNEQIYNNNQ